MAACLHRAKHRSSQLVAAAVQQPQPEGVTGCVYYGQRPAVRAACRFCTA